MHLNIKCELIQIYNTSRNQKHTLQCNEKLRNKLNGIKYAYDAKHSLTMEDERVINLSIVIEDTLKSPLTHTIKHAPYTHRSYHNSIATQTKRRVTTLETEKIPDFFRQKGNIEKMHIY